MRVTVVLPVFNEAGNIGPLVSEIYDALAETLVVEVIVADDGSEDTTGEEVASLIAGGRHPRLRYLRHARRVGQSAALRTGIMAANTPIIVTMDGDGQNDPRDIAKLLARLARPGASGPRLVGGWRTARKASSSKRLASGLANKLRDAILRDRCPDTGCGLKVFWRDDFLRLPYFASMHRYLPALFRMHGHEVDFVPVNDRPRCLGQSKYTNVSRALAGALDLCGVVWLRWRTQLPVVVERQPEPNAITNLSGRITGGAAGRAPSSKRHAGRQA